MNIRQKIEEIRKKPEHIRLRYVWGCVAVSMVVIFAFWIFSLSAMFKQDSIQNSNSDNFSDLKNQLQNFNKQAPSIKDITGTQQENNSPEGVNNQDQNSDFQYPAQNKTDIPQSSTYSDLSNSANSDSSSTDSTVQAQYQ